MKPLIVVTMGDAAGIGPEVTVKALLSREVRELCRAVVIGDGDIIQLDLEKGYVINHTQNENLKTMPIPNLMREFLRDGGVVKHFKKHGGFKIET